MGLLDDAIREHLDLKRRRGADPTEIERAEQEALGPVRRDPFDHSLDESESAAMTDDGLRAYDHEYEQYDDEAYEEYDAEEEWEEEYEEQRFESDASHFTPEEAPEPPRGDFAEPTRLMDHEALDRPDAESAPPPYPAEAGAGDETMQYDVEEALASESGHEEHAPDWVESDEWAEPSQEPIEPEPADKGPRFETGPEQSPADAHDEDAHGEPGAETGKPDDDVLGETPEFLQDGPDQDRLWFEQRPPRDFDFDG